MKSVKEVEAELLTILKTEVKEKVPVKVNIVGIGPAYTVTFEDGTRFLTGGPAGIISKEIMDKTFPVVRQMWS